MNKKEETSPSASIIYQEFSKLLVALCHFNFRIENNDWKSSLKLENLLLNVKRRITIRKIRMFDLKWRLKLSNDASIPNQSGNNRILRTFLPNELINWLSQNTSFILKYINFRKCSTQFLQAESSLSKVRRNISEENSTNRYEKSARKKGREEERKELECSNSLTQA